MKHITAITESSTCNVLVPPLVAVSQDFPILCYVNNEGFPDGTPPGLRDRSTASHPSEKLEGRAEDPYAGQTIALLTY